MLRKKLWEEIRIKILKRDNSKCRECGKPAKDVHHITPFRISYDDREENLVTLCKSCHKKADNYYIRYGLTTKMKNWIQENR